MTDKAIHLSLAHSYYFKLQENMDYHFFLLLYLQFLEQHWRQSRHSKNTGCLDNLCWWFLTQRLQVSKNWLKNKMSLEYLEEAFTRFSEGLGRPLSCRGTEQTCLRWRYRCRARNQGLEHMRIVLVQVSWCLQGFINEEAKPALWTGTCYN